MKLHECYIYGKHTQDYLQQHLKMFLSQVSPNTEGEIALLLFVQNHHIKDRSMYKQ